MSKMSSHDPFKYLKHKLWSKEELGIALIYSRVGGVLHIVGKFLTRATIFL
jgi:hypothetical protein